MAAKMTESEYREFQKRTGLVDEEQRRNTALEILLNVGIIQDRQALEYWSPKVSEQKRKDRVRREDEEDRRERQRKLNRMVRKPRKEMSLLERLFTPR